MTKRILSLLLLTVLLTTLGAGLAGCGRQTDYLYIYNWGEYMPLGGDDSIDVPELFEQYVLYGAELVLAGHAHGGQFRLPWLGGLIAPDQGLLPRWTAGVYRQENTAMVVSRGLGNSVMPLRIGNPPELVVVTLRCRS